MNQLLQQSLLFNSKQTEGLLQKMKVTTTYVSEVVRVGKEVERKKEGLLVKCTGNNFELLNKEIVHLPLL